MNICQITNSDFKLFLILWNQQQNLTTPELHLRIAVWLEQAWKNGDKRLLLMAFRSAGKSTIIGIFAAWLLYRNPNLRILVLAADSTLAKKMVRNVKRIIERHPLTKHLRPKKADQWASDRFTVKRMLELRDPSMIAHGVSSNITGSRADVVICDDVEVPNTCDSAEKRENLRERLAEMAYVLVAGGTQLYVGTPHHYYSIYADEPRHEIGEDEVFLDRFKRLILPLLNEQGESTWPERYSPYDMAQIKRATGPNKFESQMMLRPVNIAEGRLNPSLLHHYSEELDYTRELQTMFIGQTKIVSASCWWDPAFASAKSGVKGDSSVCAVVFADALGNFYLHHVAYIKTDEQDKTDEATQQARIVANIAKTHYLPSITVEINGIGRFLPNILRNALTKAHAPCRVNEASSTRAKDIRIIEGFDALLASRRLYVHESVTKTPFLMEMREWRPKGGGQKSSAHDDGLDAVAGALSLQPDRMERLYGRGEHSWMKGTKAHKAKSDFKV
ncbi:MAG: phage terminase large subunit [Alphaproteobacteria bacterium]